ncbi:MAG TPA: CAP domain-containing protein [Actinomycetota bacterium]
MRTKIVRMALVAALGGLLLGAMPSGANGATTTPLRPRHAMLRATNASRYHHSLHRVWINRDMSDLARKHSLAMANSNTLFHTSDPAGYYLKGIKWHYWGENVGVTGGTVRDMESAFMASAPHRANILHSTFRHVAIGAVRVDGVLWVTVFFYS